MGILSLKKKDKIQKLGDIKGFLAYEGVQLKHSTYYVVCPYGIGDTLYVASLIESYRLQHPEIKRVCLIVKQGHSQIPDWFNAVDEKIVSNVMVNDLNLFSVLTGTWNLKNYLYGHFHKDKNFKLLPEYENIEVKNMVYRYKKLVFHLPVDSIMEEPKILPDPELQMELMEKYEIGERSIILMPYANSTMLMDNGFWEAMAEMLKGMGFQVFTNVSGSELPIKGTQGLGADIATTAALCESCGLVVALRSGLCDVLAFTDTRLVTINLREYYFNEWNLNAATEREHIYNFLVGRDNINMSLLKILQE